ncbi:hypothetical protein ASG52_20035 [Methylobacterium sp. Leaf456]|uniref:hypothetical protein n=1 Tax=Methylobacterium sp. Leaf456 TaxID=1736382 RepID=UPI0006FE3D0D|nr:hypothetical protein [Methylobacterium sp. Leaf456]KQT59679.1 hypothetical protein ASG52_20035 [Methylobacterium sp. Leaf456]
MMPILILIVWTPALLLALGLGLAFLTGCHVDEGSRHPCVICGLDLGGLLYTLTMMGWLMIPMLPFMLLTILAGLWFGLRALAGAWWA